MDKRFQTDQINQSLLLPPSPHDWLPEGHLGRFIADMTEELDLVRQRFCKVTTTNAVRLNTVSAGNGFDEMKPLKKIIGDSRIVALGEAPHGTRKFFQLKHRMLEFLATEMGFTVFSIEANMPEANRI